MAAATKIEWCDATFNPWVGCTKVSAACDNCYAESWAKRAGTPELWTGERRRTSAAYWREPLKWNRQAAAAGVRKRVFCASLADVFDRKVPKQWRADLWQLIRDTPNLMWMLLTKRPQYIREMLPDDWGDGYPNVMLGTTAENQPEADRRIPHVLAVPARLRFVSYEPALGSLNLRVLNYEGMTLIDALAGRHGLSMAGECAKLDLVICGGESGPGARPMHPDWVRGVRDQCVADGVRFFFKQWGEWAPGETVERQRGVIETAKWFDDEWTVDTENLATADGHIDDEPDLYRVGKKKAGAMLDGREWRQFPELPRIPA